MSQSISLHRPQQLRKNAHSEEVNLKYTEGLTFSISAFLRIANKKIPDFYGTFAPKEGRDFFKGYLASEILSRKMDILNFKL